MNKNVNCNIVYNFRDLIEKYKIFGENIVFKYKQKGKLVNITYKKFIEDVKAIRNGYLEFRRCK